MIEGRVVDFRRAARAATRNTLGGCAVRLQSVRDAARRQPFVPFFVNITDGRRFFVPHAEFVYVVPGERAVVIAQPGGAIEIVDAQQVSSLTTFDVPASASVNGS